jgi:trimethylamine--corrinoid protein Co-methyltransferase
MAGLAGLNMIYEAVGMHASLLGFSIESMILGDDMLGQALRCVRGIEVTDATVSIDAMKEVCLGGPGHYLGHGQTLAMMQSEYVYPRLGDRLSPKEWAEVGKPDLLANARKRKREILDAPKKPVIDPAVDAAIRAKFRIHFT